MRYAVMARDERFRLLRRRFARLALAIAGSFLGWYFLYVALSAFARDFMARTVVGNINVALVLGVLQFASTFALAWCYARYASEALDPVASALRDEADAPAAIRAGRQRAALHPGEVEEEAMAAEPPMPPPTSASAPPPPPATPSAYAPAPHAQQAPHAPYAPQVPQPGRDGGPPRRAEPPIDMMQTQPLPAVLPHAPGPPQLPPGPGRDDRLGPDHRAQPEPGVGPLPRRPARQGPVPGQPAPAEGRPGPVEERPGQVPSQAAAQEESSDAWSGPGVRPDPGWLR